MSCLTISRQASAISVRWGNTVAFRLVVKLLANQGSCRKSKSESLVLGVDRRKSKQINCFSLRANSNEDLDTAAGETRADRLAELSNIPFETLFCPATTEQVHQANVANQGKFTTHYYAVAGPTDTAESSDGTRTYTYRELNPEPSGGQVSLNGLFSPDDKGRFRFARGLRDIRDGASNTVIFGEIATSPQVDSTTTDRGGWAFGATYQTGGSQSVQDIYVAKSISDNINRTEKTAVNELSFSSVHNGGVNFAFGDGSVRFVRDRVSLDILKTFASISRLETPERLEE